MSTALATLTTKLAARLNMGDGADLIETLKATAFKSEKPATDAQLTALMVVANEYGLNPWTREIYAFPDSRNGIVPVVGVDGWSRIINSNDSFDGMEFEQDDAKCTCIIFRKDRSHPIKVTEYLSECSRPTMAPWKSHPKRMLRHKAMIQCARIAFGYGGIYDQDEAERIVESIDGTTGEGIQPKTTRQELPAWPADAFATQYERWSKAVAAGLKTPTEILALARSKGTLSPEQEKAIQAISLRASTEGATDAQPKEEAQDQAGANDGWDEFQKSE